MTPTIRVILIWTLVISSFYVGLDPTGHRASASQSEDPVITIDAPGRGAMVRSGSRLSIGGWAADPSSSSGLGVNAVEGAHVYFGRPAGEGGVGDRVPFGTARPDVANAYGRPDWTSAGFGGELVVPPLPLGPSTLYVYVYFARTGWQSISVPIEVEIEAPVVGGTQPSAPLGSIAPGAFSTPAPAYTPSDVPGPTNLTLIVAGPTSATLRWRPPSGMEVVSYRVYLGATTAGGGVGGRTPVPTTTLFNDCLIGTPTCPGAINWLGNNEIRIEGLPYAPVRTFFVTGVTPDGRETAPSNRVRMVLGPDPFG